MPANEQTANVKRVSIDTCGVPEEIPICMHNSIGPFLNVLKTWAATQPDIVAVAIVGSHARGMARPDSDIDVIVIVDDPARYLEMSAWLECFGNLRSVSNENWGLLQSRRAHYVDGMEVSSASRFAVGQALTQSIPELETLSQTECFYLA